MKDPSFWLQVALAQWVGCGDWVGEEREIELKKMKIERMVEIG
ncbi:MAG: hypothetical protein ABSG59_03360 [Verrucomicrobiota bacterium]|jgi:hypothetical protein